MAGGNGKRFVKMSENNKKKNVVDVVKSYIKETQAEAKKVSWPSRQYVFTATLIIIVMVLVLSFVLSFLDYGLTNAILFLTRIRL
ncbi:preprotein translocase subunit SecE [candidate division WOR-1 bacterium RIFOXYD2_FULL_36_8]|uniref:Protein translocase subunit SecE n=1 Tax=candidate division WOR-1 bacterium RIFOXYB2_FULL_36_35 TaxID=1802578 RepID=A0A1F4S530_UNCSA|nr:MAG: preprotein translocase subunit SecE [candidate division WOR-1 bacterium RIFOXYA2_FULL_36_21]OGC15541.1 MAG: preprotein translocase subunit SecE [candidate division WOR-1 bacterium RIFOXYB2_FULL_36_35]OGC21326.1 MAG: preprotein translocase subunit SecE [candidate division WOR-1 bacterium RIFOXYA12_FULL_36_13]OGC37648.1 MAG: preprotein translocase subunit SecE [candidate division WOR-1 bacterium RIFOXYD2_FULL_36_8]